MLSKKAGITIAVVAAAILAALMAILAALIMYGLGITGEQTAGVRDAIQPLNALSARRRRRHHHPFK
jgi:hypothetical protein